MIQSLFLLTLTFLSSNLVLGLSTEDPPVKKKFTGDQARIAMNNTSVFVDHVQRTDGNGGKINVFAPGASYTYYEGWGDDDREAGTFMGGGYIRILMGYGITKGARWIPYDYSCGAFGNFVLNNPKHEIGFDYGMIGIYGYSDFAFFGSNFTLKYRFSRIQLEATRGGTGIFVGFIKPRFDSEAAHLLGLSYILKNNNCFSLRRGFIPSGGSSRIVKETRFAFSFNL